MLIIIAAAAVTLVLKDRRSDGADLGSAQTEMGSSQPAEELSDSSAETEEQEEEALPEGPTVYINGEEMDARTELVKSTVMASAEELADKLDAKYEYDSDSGEIKLSWDDYYISMTVDSRRAQSSGGELRVRAPYVGNDGTVMVPAVKTAKALGAGTMKLNGELYLTAYAGITDIPRGYDVPVLMYHAVGDNMWGNAELFVSPSDMEQQLKYLSENGYTTITFEDLYRIDEIDKPVLLTFDDGYDDNYENLYPLLKKYNCKATIFMITHSLEDGVDPADTHKMTAEQIKELSDSGLVSIQSHTVMHYELGTLSEAEQEAQMKYSRRQLLELTGKQPFVLCYPVGSYDSTTLALLHKYYNYGIKINGGQYNTSDDSGLVNRYYISRYTDLSTFAGYVG